MRQHRRNRLATLATGLLILAASVAAAGDLVDKEPIYPDLLSALQDSGLSLDQNIKMDPVSFDSERGVAVYKFLALTTQDTHMAQVVSTSDPLADTEDQPLSEDQQFHAAAAAADIAESAAVGGMKGVVIGNPASGRCDLVLYDYPYLSSQFFRTNLDFNHYGYIGGINDRASSLRTYCSPAVLFTKKNWEGSSLFVAANTVINDLGVFGMSNHISSHFIVCD